MFIFSKIISSCFSKNFKIFPASCFPLTDTVWKSTCFWKLTRLSVILLRATSSASLRRNVSSLVVRNLLLPLSSIRPECGFPEPSELSVFKAERIFASWYEIPLLLDQFYIYSSVVSGPPEYYSCMCSFCWDSQSLSSRKFASKWRKIPVSIAQQVYIYVWAWFSTHRSAHYPSLSFPSR